MRARKSLIRTILVVTTLPGLVSGIGFSSWITVSSQEIKTTDIMLMYGKEASNRKQEIDRQHYTIPNQRPKDKHCGKI